MIPPRIAALIGIRILAVYGIFLGLCGLPMIVQVVSRGEVIYILVPLLSYVSLGIVLWFLAAKVAGWIVKDEETQDTTSLNIVIINRMFVSFLGLSLLANSFSRLINTIWVMCRDTRGPGVNQGLLQSSLAFIVGVVLIFWCEPIARFLSSVQRGEGPKLVK